MKTVPSYEYCINMAAQYVMHAQVNGHSLTFDADRADENLVQAARWIRNSRQALAARKEQS